jgi:hypothetical protein
MGLLCSLNFTEPENQSLYGVLPQLKAFETRFGSEFGPSSLAAD